MRRGIVRAMNASAAIPQFTIEMEAMLGPLDELRAEVLADGGRLSYGDVLTAACAAALVEHPGVNASFREDQIVEHADVNVGLAMALEDGLIAPAIRNADSLGLAEIEAERVRLAEAARVGSLEAEDVLAATFTISNLGPYGVTRFQALVVPPQAAILAVGARSEAGTMSLALSCDHRVLDGAPAAQFLAALVLRLTSRPWIEGRM
jgi:pyruvate dehydrogenase E2 component (dihydrolipoamide acetyltransferase)